MRCTRCGGLMVLEEFEDLGLGPSGYGLCGWRCINCGAIVDPVIAAHRRLTSQAALESGTDNRVRTLRPCHVYLENWWRRESARRLPLRKMDPFTPRRGLSPQYATDPDDRIRSGPVGSDGESSMDQSVARFQNRRVGHD